MSLFSRVDISVVEIWDFSHWARRTSEPQAADSPSEEEKSKNLCDKARLLKIKHAEFGGFLYEQ